MKIMKLHLNLEMRLKEEPKTKFLQVIRLLYSIIFCCLLTLSCGKKSLKKNIVGKWEVISISWNNGTISEVPQDERYELHLTEKGNKSTFKVDDVLGNWTLDDSLIIFKNIPESKTFVDSIFVENDAFGNSSIVLKNGNQLIATITKDGIEPEVVTQVLKLIYVDEKELKLSNNGDIYVYNRITK